MYEAVIGLEVHVNSLQTQNLLGIIDKFCAEPNSQASLIDLGMPGVVPCLMKAFEMAVKFDSRLTPKLEINLRPEELLLPRPSKKAAKLVSLKSQLWALVVFLYASKMAPKNN